MANAYSPTCLPPARPRYIQVRLSHRREWNPIDHSLDSIAVGVGLLRAHGPALRRPHSGSIRGSAYPNMRELVVQHAGHPYRVLYAFDPRRIAILLIGGDKTGDERWYDVNVPLADRLYEQHLETLKREEHW